MLNCYDLTSMTWKEVKESLTTVQLAIIPIGAHEQHGPHMVESCDAVLAERMAKKLGQRIFHMHGLHPLLIWGFPTPFEFSRDHFIAANDTYCDSKRYDFLTETPRNS